jgi:hypothetical protein
MEQDLVAAKKDLQKRRVYKEQNSDEYSNGGSGL